MTIYNHDTNATICQEKAVYGEGVVHADPTPGDARHPHDKFAERGYIAVPPCVWGSTADGLEPPPNLANVTLRVVKHSNATHGHHGEMAHGEIYYVDTPARAGTAEWW